MGEGREHMPPRRRTRRGTSPQIPARQDKIFRQAPTPFLYAEMGPYHRTDTSTELPPIETAEDDLRRISKYTAHLQFSKPNYQANRLRLGSAWPSRVGTRSSSSSSEDLPPSRALLPLDPQSTPVYRAKHTAASQRQSVDLDAWYHADLGSCSPRIARSSTVPSTAPWTLGDGDIGTRRCHPADRPCSLAKGRSGNPHCSRAAGQDQGGSSPCTESGSG